MDFYVIGATTCDIILSNLHDLIPKRKTDDLDIAIALTDWSQFQSIEENLPKLKDLQKVKTRSNALSIKKFHKCPLKSGRLKIK